MKSLSLIAQAEAAKPEVELSSAEMLVASFAMVVFVASFVTVVRSFLRWKNGEVVIPAAQRKPLHVPTAVAVIGVIIASLLASVATATSLDEALAENVAQQQEAGEDPLTDDSGKQQLDERDDQLVEPKGGKPADKKEFKDMAEPNQDVKAMAWNMITGTLGMFGILFFLFGTLVWLTQADGPGRSVQIAEVRSEALEEDSTQSGQIRSLNTSFADFVGSSQDALSTLQSVDSSAEIESSVVAASGVVHERWSLWVELKFAGLAFLMALVPTIAMRLFVVSLMPEPKSHPFIEMMDGGGLTIPLLVLLMLIATVVAPLVEELLYRVVVLGGLLNRRSKGVAIGVSTVLFSFAHGFPDCISLLPLAVILGYTYVQRRSYRTVILVHLIFNAFNMSLALLQMVG